MKYLEIIEEKYGNDMKKLISLEFKEFVNNKKLFDILSLHFQYNKYLLEDIKKQDKLQQFVNFLKSKVASDNSNSEIFKLKGYVEINKKNYKVLYEIKNRYYSFNNLIIELDRSGKEKHLIDFYSDTNRFIIVENFVFDLEEKSISSYKEEDSFIDCFKDIKDIEIRDCNVPGRQDIVVKFENKEDVIIGINENRQIISYINNNIEEIEYGFLKCNTHLEYIELKNVKKIEDLFLLNNIHCKKAVLPNVSYISHGFLRNNKVMEEIDLPKVTFIGIDFMLHNEILKIFNAPNLVYILDRFLMYNRDMEMFVSKKLIKVGAYCLHSNNKLIVFYTPLLERIGFATLSLNETLKLFYAPNLKAIDSSCENYCLCLVNNEICEDIVISNSFCAQRDFFKSNTHYLRIRR